MLLAALATLVGAAVQSATGFGFALLAAPAFLAAVGREEAVATVLVLSLALNVLMLAGEGRRPEVLGRPLAILLAAAVPAIVAGAFVLRALSKPLLQVLAGALIVLAGTIAARRPPWPGRRPGPPAAVGVGLAAGALTTTTTINGPPIVLWLQRLGAGTGQARDSLAAAFAVLNLLGAAVVAIVGGAGSGPRPLTVLWLLPVLVAGQLVGRRIFERLDPARFRALAVGLVLAAGLASVVAGVAAA
jgi:uncharacterized membrane protein YfcA